MADPTDSTPLVMIVGSDDERFAETCRRAAERLGAQVEMVTASLASERAVAAHPAVLVLPVSLFASAPEAFEQLAERARSTLMTVDESALDPGELELLLDATLAGAAARQEAAVAPPARPFRDKPD